MQVAFVSPLYIEVPAASDVGKKENDAKSRICPFLV